MSGNQHSRIKTIIKWVIAAIAAILFFIFLNSFYLQKANIYQPVEIEISGLKAEELQQLKVYGITPLNRTYYFTQTDTNRWQNGYSFLNNIGFGIPDTVCRKIISLQISVGPDKYICTTRELQAVKGSKEQSHFLLPANICNSSNFFQKLFSVTRWVKIGRSANVFIFIALLFFAFFITYKIFKKRIHSFPSFIKFAEKLRSPLNHKIRTWTRIIVYSLFIGLVLFYGFILILFSVSSYITALLFILTSCFILYHLTGFIFHKTGVRNTSMKQVRLLFLIILFIWICLEAYLRTDRSLSTYNEQQHLFYSSGFNENHVLDNQNPDLWIHQSNLEYTDKKIEFEYKIKTNNEGLRDIDHAIEKQKDEFRIICIGNSFTEGTGTPQDSTWPKLLENIINDSLKKKVTVFNAGKAGSDLFFGYRLLVKKMLKYKPDMVLLFIASSDFEFYRFRGGFERFTDDGCQFRKGPWWEKFYAMSYICRFFTDRLLHYKYFFTPAEFTKDSTQAMNDIYQCIYKFQDLSSKENFKFALISCDDPGLKLTPVVDALKQENIISVIDLAEYDRKIEKLTPFNRKRYFWPTDGHCNSRGYLMFARGIYWNLGKFGYIDSLK